MCGSFIFEHGNLCILFATNSDGLFVLVIRRSDCIDDGVNATVSCLFVVSTSNESMVALMVAQGGDVLTQ